MNSPPFLCHFELKALPTAIVYINNIILVMSCHNISVQPLLTAYSQLLFDIFKHCFKNQLYFYNIYQSEEKSPDISPDLLLFIHELWLLGKRRANPWMFWNLQQY
jgi:hypothetical protein